MPTIKHTPASNGTIGVSAGYTETRPINKGVNYIIKYQLTKIIFEQIDLKNKLKFTRSLKIE